MECSKDLSNFSETLANKAGIRYVVPVYTYINGQGSQPETPSRYDALSLCLELVAEVAPMYLLTPSQLDTIPVLGTNLLGISIRRVFLGSKGLNTTCEEERRLFESGTFVAKRWTRRRKVREVRR